jgi:DNA-directed RNA polymerase subunit RPC12/RpoP
LTLIKCPHCGHTVLSVASHCPGCSRPLGQAFLGLNHEGALAQCRECGHQVRTRTRMCPHCGAQDPARWSRAARTALMATLGVGALVVLALVATSRRLADGTLPAVATPETTATVVARPETTTAPPAPTTATASAGDTVSKSANADSSAGLQTRWTTSWVNLRSAPSNEAPIVRVLRPGTAVHGTAAKWGWWATHLSGDSVGYVAGALLSTREPGG